ncbi:MAG: hypothetical protein CL577_07565 [Alteromonadaceae bacterium]|nr:hypothetical protein [Alteromonadaceae bacterium]|tara:strand:+ start:2222 stop:2578 length:357 start_codon:yes stop_codon:yes gene_type:complete
MNFSGDLIEQLKNAKQIKSDAGAAEIIPAMTKGRLSEVKSGKRHLTEEQALYIAHECNLNVQWVLVQLAEETAKSEEAKTAWANLAKKISRSATAALLAVIVIFSGLDTKQDSSPVLS